VYGDCLLRDGKCVQSAVSLTFPELAIAELIPALIQQAMHEGTSQMLRGLRNQFLA
jgi:hypothetical protein